MPTPATEGQSSASAENITQVEVEQHQVKTSTNNHGTSQFIQVAQGLTISQHLVNRVFSKVISPKFRRDANSYTSFWNLFENALHKNGGLAVIGKFIFFTRYWKARQQERYKVLPWRQQIMVQPSKALRIALEDHSISSRHIW